MVTDFIRPRDSVDALSIMASRGDILPLGGGTELLSLEGRPRRFAVLLLEGILSRAVTEREGQLEIGAAATFQDLLDSEVVPAAIKVAAARMIDRNIRNRATVGGNLGADRPCSSLIPLFLALEASLLLLDGRRMSLEAWLESSPGPSPRAIVSLVAISRKSGLRSASTHWARTSCDHSVLGCAAAYRLEAGLVHGLRLAVGGIGEHSRRVPEMEALFEGRPLPKRDDIEASVSPLLRPDGDFRASAEFKRLRTSTLVADALAEAL